MKVRRISAKKAVATSNPVLVCNAIETGRYKPLIGDWIDYWEEKTGMDKASITCQHPDCQNSEVVGAHVISLNERTPHIYIAPMCETCNDKKCKLVPFKIKRSLCVPMPDKCLYLNDNDEVVEINNANERIRVDNRKNVAKWKFKLKLNRIVRESIAISLKDKMIMRNRKHTK